MQHAQSVNDLIKHHILFHHSVKWLTIGDNLVWFKGQLGIILSFTCIQSPHLSPANQWHNPVGWCLRTCRKQISYMVSIQ